MDWSERIDGYCERLGTEFWAEPLNALTNAAFLIAALWLWRRCADYAPGRVLAVILFAIGLGSFLFHTFATPWAALTDVVPILAFILFYFYQTNRQLWGLGPLASAGLAAGFVPLTVVLTPLFGLIPFLAISAFYWPVPLLIVVVGLLLRTRAPRFSRDILIGAGILIASLVARSLDELLCHAVPMGTHIFWHLLNAAMLGWMIEALRAHHARAAGGA